MPNIFDKALFRSPKFSMFEQSENRKQSIPIGQNIPVYYQELYAGDEIDINLVQLTKFMPVLAPIFHRFSVDFIPAFVPFRLLGDNGFWDADKFFNPATADEERPAIPMVSPLQLYSGIDKIVGSVWDYLKYPKFIWVLQRLQSGKYTIYVYDDEDKEVTSIVAGYNDLFVFQSPVFDGNVEGTVIIDSNLDITANVLRLYPWIIQKIKDADANVDTTDISDESDYWDTAFRVLGLKQDQVVNKYINYLHLNLVLALLNGHTAYTTQSLSLLPWLCYRQLMDDWFKNTNIQDVDSINLAIKASLDDLTYISNVFEDALDGSIPGLGSNGNYIADCDHALWASDYFTSAFASPQDGNAVPIPVNGTIPDLRTASRLQKMKEKVIYGGKRLIDQIFVHRGVKSPDARYHRSEILGHQVYNLRVDDVLQTSSGNIDSSLADFAGYVQSTAGDHLCHYRASEAGLIMVICRVRPRTEYIDACPRFILKSDFYDFENPDFDNVGMQPVLLNEIQYQGIGLTRVFGWQRRYTEYMCGLDSIAGDLSTNMDYWHAARMIDTQPALNEQFITMNPDEDGYNRIFAVPGNDRPIVQYLHFDVKTARPLSRYVSFSF